ncbi:uncharacterized protein VP01_4148g2 [Puccinia sorghi]|uniref:Uncharacterized protein n=1 Tax=Puccinia sorghi TaxID=27349 RepID=A0A0L6URW8_9BASI|nr:uncharacterized protein VP01_4148g2 [Puccinia sorghi]
MVIAKPQPFDGTRGSAAKEFIGKIGLHAVTYPKQFPTDASKVVFSVSFMRNYAETCLSRTWAKSSTRNQWSLMTSSTISDSAKILPKFTTPIHYQYG